MSPNPAARWLSVSDAAPSVASGACFSPARGPIIGADNTPYRNIA
jgi:hypothetical protein